MLAEKLQVKTEPSVATSSTVSTRVEPKDFRFRITKFEGLLIGLFSVGVLLFSLKAIDNYSKIYHLNREVIDLQNAIADQSVITDELSNAVSELSTPDRIRTIAEKQGLTFKDENVKQIYVDEE